MLLHSRPSTSSAYGTVKKRRTRKKGSGKCSAVVGLSCSDTSVPVRRASCARGENDVIDHQLPRRRLLLQQLVAEPWQGPHVAVVSARLRHQQPLSFPSKELALEFSDMFYDATVGDDSC